MTAKGRKKGSGKYTEPQYVRCRKGTTRRVRVLAKARGLLAADVLREAVETGLGTMESAEAAGG